MRSNLAGGQSRSARFKVQPLPKADPWASRVYLTWLESGHTQLPGDLLGAHCRHGQRLGFLRADIQRGILNLHPPLPGHHACGKVPSLGTRKPLQLVRAMPLTSPISCRLAGRLAQHVDPRVESGKIRKGGYTVRLGQCLRSRRAKPPPKACVASATDGLSNARRAMAKDAAHNPLSAAPVFPRHAAAAGNLSDRRRRP